MKWLSSWVILMAGFSPALAELTIDITATHNGEPTDSSNIKLEPLEGMFRPSNQSYVRQSPPSKPGSLARSLGSATTANWCGGLTHPPSPSTQYVSSVHAYFQVPTVYPRAGVNSYPQMIGQWVGIDGATHPVILQAGIGQEVRASQPRSYQRPLTGD